MQDPFFEARVRDSFARQKAMATIGATLARVEAGACEIELPFREDLTQQKGFVHGGIVGMISDSAAGYAAYTLMPASASFGGWTRSGGIATNSRAASATRPISRLSD